MARAFLTAEWRYLAMLNYRVDPHVLHPYVPAGTQLDSWQGETCVSLVGFLFRNTRLLGVPVPWHRHFEELNLRLYVRRTERREVRRGVTFVRELVPRHAIAVVARLAYNEPYQALPMRHRLGSPRGRGDTPQFVEYEWRQRAGWSRLRVEPAGEPEPLRSGSVEEFIAEHHLGIHATAGWRDDRVPGRAPAVARVAGRRDCAGGSARADLRAGAGAGASASAGFGVPGGGLTCGRARPPATAA